ncbi:MAG: hypothetical protein N2505_00020 [Endomicrobia bacterium]|nr:hypothetical protein [Endomicrobiia bacterium]
MTTDYFLEEFLKKKGFDEKIVRHIRPHNVEKQIEKVKQLSEREIEHINNILLKIHNKQYIFPLFYSLICKIDIESIANIDFFGNNEPQKNKRIYDYRIPMEHAIDSLTHKFNIDSIILIIELMDERLCNIEFLKDNGENFQIDEINEKTLKVIKKITTSQKYASVSSRFVKKLEKCIDEPYFDLLIDIKADITMIQDIEELYSFNSLTNEKICILNTSIEKVIRKYYDTDIIKYILAKFETIKQIGWKRFVSIDFTKFNDVEFQYIEDVMKYLTVENFHHLLNYDGDFHKLLFYLIMNDDNLANQAIKYLPSLIESIKLESGHLLIYRLIQEISNFVELYKNSKPFDFLFKPYCLDTKNMLTELILKEYPYELVTNEEFMKRINNLNDRIENRENALIIRDIQEGIYKNLNIFLFGDTYEEVTMTKNILEKKYKLPDHIKRIKELIRKYLTLEKDEKMKKELLTYLTTTKTKKRKIILYPIVIDLMNNINKRRKSLFYLAFEKNIGCSLVETKMINEFKQFLSL